MPEQYVLEKPWALHPTPEVLDEMIEEVVDTQKPGYRHIPEGTPHPDRQNYPAFLLVEEKPISQFRVRRVWATPSFVNQDVYNYGITYSAESNSHPVFARRYLYRRDEYFASMPLQKGTNMTGVWLVRVTDGGSGYNPEVPPIVTISGGSGAGATAVAQVDTGGVVRWVRITAEGTGYTSVPTVTIAPPLAGVVATATAVIQQSAGNVVTGFTIINPGAGYNSAPAISFTGGGGSGATAQAQVKAGALTGLVVIDSGYGYSSPPTVVITPTPPDVPSVVAVATATLEELKMRLVQEQVTPLPDDDDKASLFVVVLRVYETLPSPPLQSWQWDDKLRLNVEILKRIVWVGDVPATRNSFTENNGTITEYQSTENKYRAIQIVSRIPSTPPDDYVFYTYTNYRFPDVIRGTPKIAVAFAENANGSIAQDVGLEIDIREGYAGPCKARVTRKFTYTPNAAFLLSLPAITVFNPQAHSVITAFTLSSDTQVAARITTFGIPQTLHPALTFDVDPALPGSGDWVTPSIPATVPTNIPSAGSWIVVDVNPTQWRFGLWIYDITEIQVPNFT